MGRTNDIHRSGAVARLNEALGDGSTPRAAS